MEHYRSILNGLNSVGRESLEKKHWTMGKEGADFFQNLEFNPDVEKTIIEYWKL